MIMSLSCEKGIGDTKIIVPVDVAVSLKVNSLYGGTLLLGQTVRELRNEYFSDYARF